MEMTIEEAANAVANEFNATVLAYSGAIDREGYMALLEEMVPRDDLPPRTNAFLLLATDGGDADFAYRIARFFQTVFERFYICIPGRCKSAGTLIALGANELIMSGYSEIGPLDVQLTQRDEIGQMRSGLVVRKALEGLSEETMKIYENVMLGIKRRSRQAISFEVASRVAASMATGVMAPVYAQISPEALGNDLRDLAIARDYGERLIEHGKNADLETIRTLIEDYPSHRFIIDRSEAEQLFNTVPIPTDSVTRLITTLGSRILLQQRRRIVRRLDTENVNTTKGEEGDATGDDDKARNGDAKNPEDLGVVAERQGNQPGDAGGSKAREDRTEAVTQGDGTNS